MPTESKYAYLSAALVHGGQQNPFIHRTDVLQGVQAILPGYGIEAALAAPGIMKVRCNGVFHPTLLVDNEDFFWRIPEHAHKYKIRGMTPREWKREGLVVLDANWATNSLIADCVLQSYLVEGLPPDLFWSDPHISEEARHATKGFIAQGLDDLHRRKFYGWLQSDC